MHATFLVDRIIFSKVTQVLSWFVQKISDLEMSFISVERIKEYTRCPQEVSCSEQKHFFLSRINFANLPEISEKSENYDNEHIICRQLGR